MFPLFIDSGGYKLNFTMTFVTQCLLLYLRRRNGLLDKKKQVNMYREPYDKMIKLSTAILLLVEVEPLVCSRNLNRSEIFLVLLVSYFDLYSSGMLEFCGIFTCLKIKKEQNCMFQDPRQRTWMVTFHLKGARSTTRK